MVKTLHDVCLTCIQKRLDKIPDVGRRLPNVHKEILLERLVNHDILTEHYFKAVQKSLFMNNLRRVTLYKSDQLTDAMLKTLGERCPSMHQLTIHMCSKITDNGIKSVTKTQKELMILELRKLANFTGKGLELLKSPTLKLLDLRGCNAVTNEAVETVTRNNPTISSLIIYDCGQLSPQVFASIAQALRHNLEEIEGCPRPMTDENITALARFCPNLTNLNLLGSSKLTGNALLELSQGCTRLESLDLSYCYGLQESPDNQFLWTLPTSLTHLSLCGVLLADEDLVVETLQRLRHLKSVRLCGIPAINDITFPKILQHIGGSLEVIDISGSRVLTDVGLAAVAKYCTCLLELDLSISKLLTGHTLLPLLRDPERAPLLRKIFLSVQKIQAEVLMAMAERCCNLEKFDAAGVEKVSDHLLMTMAANCPRLKHVGIKGCKQVTDTGVCAIARCCPLKSLVLSGIQSITDKTVFTVSNHCHNLEEIYLNGCSNVSTTTINYLIDNCLPRVYVQHKTPNLVSEHIMGKNIDTGEFCRMDLLMDSGSAR
ncbi:F-box/LRR-repeat protein 20-like [Mizuhopecten yessoensis]|uniref:EIN3-binding F-box protein 1 n=1 Tax=Mizuhopecten yessoensis TaxID=6573 RepID=A0A210QL90_MIZYE|nr:F-box/LRR-repeat protein 20-like [Mizuhopecten yessoensis]OWF49485.1 EIN3-binding F-box protein 1 [Mizuhopecten yessoensis]